MKTMKRILSMILVCALVLPMVVVTANAGETQDDSYWFTDDFSYTTADLSAMGWGNPQNYDVNSNQSVSQHVNNAYMYLESATALQWSNYVVEVDVVMTNDVNDDTYLTTAAARGAGIVAAVDAIPSTNGADTVRGFEFMMMYDDRDSASLEKYCMLKSRSGTTTSVATKKAYDFELGKTYTMKMVLKNQTISCYIDNELVLGPVTVEDELTGTIGVHGMINVCEFDDVRVYSSESAPWYVDTFDSSTLASAWGTSGATSSVSGGVLNTTGNGYRYLSGITDSTTWSDYIFEADVTLLSELTGSSAPDTGWAGIYFAGDTNKKGYDFCLCKTNTGTTKVWINDRTSGSRIELKSVTKTITTDTVSYNMKVVLSGNTFTCYLNGEELIEHPVTSVSSISGTAGLTVSGYKAKYDNVCVKSSKTTPWYNEQFNTGDVATKGWTNGQSRMSVANGVLNVGYSQCGSSTVYTYLSEQPIEKGTTNFMVEADVTMTDTVLNSDGSNPLVALVVGAEQNNISAEDGYQFLIDKNGNAKLLDRYGDENSDLFTDISKSGNTFLVGTTYNLKVAVNNNTIRCYVDDVLKIEQVCTSTDNLFAGLIGIRAGVNAVTVDNVSIRPAVQCEDNYYDVDYYRSNLGTESAPYIHPYKDGEVFAGWYADATYTTPIESTTTTGYAYAKFVDKNVLSVKAQLDGNTKAASDTEKTRMRFVTTVDCLDYDKVGFVVSTPNQTATFKSSTVYETLNATGLEVPYTPDDISSDSEYFATIILGNLSATTDDLEKVFTVTPFWVTADGTTVTGITRDVDNNPITIQNGINANNNSSSSPYSLR